MVTLKFKNYISTLRSGVQCSVAWHIIITMRELQRSQLYSCTTVQSTVQSDVHSGSGSAPRAVRGEGSPHARDAVYFQCLAEICLYSDFSTQAFLFPRSECWRNVNIYLLYSLQRLSGSALMFAQNFQFQ